MKSDPSPEWRIASECFAGRVRILNRVVSGVYDDALRPHNVRISQMNILVAIAAAGPVPAGAVCRRLRLDKSTLSRDLERLLARGLVQSTPGGGRVQNLEATDAGRALIRTVTPAWEAAQERVRELLGASLANGLLKAAEKLQAEESAGG